MEPELVEATKTGRTEDVESLLRDNPGLNVNWADKADFSQLTALHVASLNGHGEVVKLLLAHPNIIVNVKDTFERTPFALGCANGRVPAVQLLLKDSRVNTTIHDKSNRTPLWAAAFGDHRGVIERFIASGRDLGDLGRKGRSYEDDQEYTVLEISRQKHWKVDVFRLLERFLKNPAQTRRDFRVRFGVLEELAAAELYALTVFLCDGLLQLKPAQALVPSGPAAAPTAAATRFFAMVSKLPMELQMILCHRVVGSKKQNIPHNDSEIAFQGLARSLLLPSQLP